MRQGAAVVAALVVALAFGVVPGGEATHEGACATDLVTIKIGTGEAAIDIPALDGINHVDLPWQCSGRAYRATESDQVIIEQHCDGEFLRVYAPAGALGYEAIIAWHASGEPNCTAGAGAPSGPDVPVAPRASIDAPPARVP